MCIPDLAAADPGIVGCQQAAGAGAWDAVASQAPHLFSGGPMPAVIPGTDSCSATEANPRPGGAWRATTGPGIAARQLELRRDDPGPLP